MYTAIAAAVIAGLTLTAQPPPLEPGDGLEAIQMRAEQATDDRIRALDNALERVSSSTALTSTHHEQIVANLTADRAAMEALASQIAAETNAVEALAAYRDVFTGYRVYAVTLPQAYYAAGADRLTELAIPRLEELYLVLADAAAGNADAEAALALLRATLDAATVAATGIADVALAVEPADFNADPSVLVGVRTDLRAAGEAVREATQAARSVRAEL